MVIVRNDDFAGALGFLDIRCFPALDSKFRYMLLTDFVYIAKNKERILVPAGFKTDFATTTFFRFVLPKTGRHNEAAVVHDYLCFLSNKGKYDRKRADEIFLEYMGILGVGVIRRKIMYAGVASFTYLRKGSHGTTGRSKRDRHKNKRRR